MTMIMTMTLAELQFRMKCMVAKLEAVTGNRVSIGLDFKINPTTGFETVLSVYEWKRGTLGHVYFSSDKTTTAATKIAEAEAVIEGIRASRDSLADCLGVTAD